MMKRHLAYPLLPALTILLAAACGDGDNNTGGGGSGTSSSTSTTGTGGSDTWTAPQCAEVSGTAAVTFTSDEGATLAPTKEMLTGVGYTYGLVALDTPNTLVAEHQGKILRSTDAGCTWSVAGTVTDSPLTLVAAKGGVAYGFKDNDKGLYRIEGTTITPLKAPALNVLGVGADAADGAHVRLGDTAGQVWESKDSGATWTAIGTPLPIGGQPLVYRYAFDPKSFDHILAGTAVTGAFVTSDGGKNWVKSKGLGQNNSNVFSIVISPSDSKVVWAQGIDLDLTNTPVSEGRFLWRSENGGGLFTPIVEQTATVHLRNQELLAPHPTDARVLYFAFGTYFQDYGTDVYRYDQMSGNVTLTHNTYDDVSAIAFSPADPGVMYLGLTSDAPPTP